jgi:hypothetical protein
MCSNRSRRYLPTGQGDVFQPAKEMFCNPLISTGEGGEAKVDPGLFFPARRRTVTRMSGHLEVRPGSLYHGQLPPYFLNVNSGAKDVPPTLRDSDLITRRINIQ